MKEKMKNLLLFVYFLLFEYSYSYYIPNENSAMILKNISFGSCYNGFMSTRYDIFKTVNMNNPQVFMWTGDVAYMDTMIDTMVNQYYQTHKLDEEYGLSRFNRTYYDEYYQILREKSPIIGIWDDHDYGINNANKYFKHKETVKNWFLNFLDEPLTSKRRTVGKSIDVSYTFGNGHKSVKFILLDGRYNRESYYIWWGDMHTDEQYEWLANELNSDETFTFIVSGTQILPFSKLATEAWYTNSRIRLFRILEEKKKSGVSLISGDVHYSEFLKTFCILPSKNLNYIRIGLSFV